MDYTIQTDVNTCLVKLNGTLTFQDSQKFRDIIEHVKTNFADIRFDMQDLTFIDSSGLGMFLLLRESVQSETTRISFKHTNGQILKMLQLSKFDKLFFIE